MSLSGWAVPVQAKDSPPLLAIETAGRVQAVIRATIVDPVGFDAPDGAIGFHWDIPALLRGGSGPLPLKVWDLATGHTLAGPDTIPTSSDASDTKVTSTVFGQEPASWPHGFAGFLALGMNEIATGLWIENDLRAQGARFERASPPSSLRAPSWALRVLSDNLSPVVLHQRLPVSLGSPEGGPSIALRLFLKMASASENVTQCHMEVALSRWNGHAFEQLRRLRRGRVFRRFAAVNLVLDLDEAERSLAASGDLVLTVSVGPCLGAVICPVVEARPKAAGAHFEDDGLVGAFDAVSVLAEMHNPSLGEAILPSRASLPQPVPESAEEPVPFTEIIVAVYNGGDVVRDCLRSVQRGTDTPFSVLMVDDGSRAYTTRMLEDVAAADPRFTLHRRDINRGYTKSINEALNLTQAPWVVILNSDTLVSDGWLGRLHAAARAVPNTGLVGPLSNAATWQSIPHAKNPDGSWSKNDFIDPEDVVAIQARLDAVSERAYPTMPVLNGFCTLISRAVFDRCGLYDEEAFPLGYGEETDICLRAGQAGFKLVVADDCFVYHQKSVSFGSATRSKLTRAGGFELRNKHLGVTIGVLEETMQKNAVMMRLRAKLASLETEIA